MPGAMDKTLRAAAVRLIGRYGAPIELRRRTGGGYDPNTGALASGGQVLSAPVLGVLERFSPAEIAAGVAEAPDVKVLLAAASVASPPQRGDELVLESGRCLQVVADPEQLYSGAQACLYSVRARG